MNTVHSHRNLKILDFDIENRPLSYGGQDFTFSDITAIAASWANEKKVHVWALGEVSTEEMLSEFKKLYDQADIVTGHYIRNHDLPIINGALVEFGMQPLSPKLTSDTKNDLLKFSGISKSQESLGAMFDLPQPKFQMNQVAWRMGNRLTPEGIALTKKRVIYDVKQHKALREYLIANNLLGKAKVWHNGK
jgi:hypothetical protein